MTRTPPRFSRTVAVAVLVPAAALLPAAAGLADEVPSKAQVEYAGRTGAGTGTGSVPVAPDGRSKGAIEHEELLRLRGSSTSPTSVTTAAEFPWTAVVTGTAAAAVVVRRDRARAALASGAGQRLTTGGGGSPGKRRRCAGEDPRQRRIRLPGAAPAAAAAGRRPRRRPARPPGAPRAR